MDEKEAYRSDQWIEAGAFVRGRIRMELAKANIEYTETKSWTTSVFRLKVTPSHWRQIQDTLRGLK